MAESKKVDGEVSCDFMISRLDPFWVWLGTIHL